MLDGFSSHMVNHEALIVDPEAKERKQRQSTETEVEWGEGNLVTQLTRVEKELWMVYMSLGPGLQPLRV